MAQSHGNPTPQPPRPQLQDSEAALLKALETSFEKLEDSSWVHGTVENVTKVSLFVREQNSDWYVKSTFSFAAVLSSLNASSFTVSSSSTCPNKTSKLSEFHESLTPSRHGQGTKSVYDEDYRLARELPSEVFGISAAGLDVTSGILPIVSSFCGSQVRAQLYKLNSYSNVRISFLLLLSCGGSVKVF
jgi:hypothetical protein